MQLIADFHIHSHHAYATSPELTLENIYYWSKLKGIHVIATGDITHPQWFKEIQTKLSEDDTGLLQLKPSYRQEIDTKLPTHSLDKPHRFILSTEVSCIYHRHGKLRKVHLVILFPNIKSVARLNTLLATNTNLQQDGRPTLAMDSYELLHNCLEIDPNIRIIPAHAWTPWFGIFGSKSGFDTLEEAFGDLTSHIRAIETGLSSDPPMNWQLESLDNITLTSSSDAHSLQKLGREATIVDSKPNYLDIIGALDANDDRLTGTIEFYPQEGKYHHDGHRACGINFSPQESNTHQNQCPVCGQPLTLGVLHRIQSLSNRPSKHGHHAKQVHYSIPLVELIAHTLGVKSITSKRVQAMYQKLLQITDEFTLLRSTPISQINLINEPVALAVANMRKGNVHITPGYDGVFGSIRVDHLPRSPQLSLV